MTLKQRIIAEIDSTGPMPFERFMEISLYDEDGFFGGGELRSVRSGDFLTSPEVSPLFGETLANLVRAEHNRLGDPFVMVEVAAGSGSLMRPLLEKVNVDAVAVETSPAARSELAGFVETTDVLPAEMRGVVLANELLDNLPMAIAQRVEDAWRERWVGVDDGRLVFVDAPPRAEVVDWLEAYAGAVPDGGWVEVQLEARRWVGDVLRRVSAGSLVLIDYGEVAENLVHRRRDGTLRTYRAHHLGPHPLDEPGATDITADVNFSALLDLHPSARLRRQDDYLTSLGLRDTLSQLRKAELEAARSGDETTRLEIRTRKTEAETLLHPRGLGDFRVLEFTV